MKSIHVTAKLGNMRQPQRFIVYPRPTNVGPEYTKIIIQSDKRIARFDVTTRKGVISSGKGGHPGIHALVPFLGATEIEVPQSLVDECLGAQPKSGDEIGPGVYVL